MDDSAKSGRKCADAADPVALTRKALKRTRQVLRESEKLLRRAKDMPQSQTRRRDDDVTLVED